MLLCYRMSPVAFTAPTTHSAPLEPVDISAVESMSVIPDEPVRSRPAHLVESAQGAPQQSQDEAGPNISTERAGDVTKFQRKSDSGASTEDHTSWHATAASCAVPQSPTQPGILTAGRLLSCSELGATGSPHREPCAKLQ